jgi:hypothetical protein
MSNISMSGKLPSGDGNGLVAILSELVRDQQQIFVAIALIDGKKVVIDKDTGEKIPTARVRRIDVILGEEDMAICRRLMERALGRRTGRETLPYDLEAEMDSAFGSPDEADYREQPGTSSSG